MRISSNSDGGEVRGTGAGGTKGVGVVSIVSSETPNRNAPASRRPCDASGTAAKRHFRVLRLPHWHGNLHPAYGFGAQMLRVLAIIACVFSAGAASAERRVALVMGDDDYRTVRKLDNAINDARTLEETLKKLGFDVFLEPDRDLRRMRRALDDFREDAKGADVALVFFAGHGVEISGENRCCRSTPTHRPSKRWKHPACRSKKSAQQSARSPRSG